MRDQTPLRRSTSCTRGRPLGKKAAKAAAADDVDIISTLASDANPNPGAAKRATKSPKRDKAALRFHE